MEIFEAIGQRKSIRAFKQDPIPMDTLKKILGESIRAPAIEMDIPFLLTAVALSIYNYSRSNKIYL